jgi:hypothetical protein
MVSLILPIFFVGSGSARLLTNVIAFGLPEYDDITGLSNTIYWRFVVFFPFFLQALLYAGLYFWITLDSPKYYIMIQDFDRAKKSIELIYSDEEDHDVILNEVIHTIHMETRSVPFRDLFESPLYWRNTMFLGILALLHEFTGYSVVNYEVSKVIEIMF